MTLHKRSPELILHAVMQSKPAASYPTQALTSPNSTKALLMNFGPRSRYSIYTWSLRVPMLYILSQAP